MCREDRIARRTPLDGHRRKGVTCDTRKMGPQTRYARSGDVSIAYQVVGEGAFDIVFVPGSVSHIELAWQVPPFREFF